MTLGRGWAPIPDGGEQALPPRAQTESAAIVAGWEDMKRIARGAREALQAAAAAAGRARAGEGVAHHVGRTRAGELTCAHVGKVMHDVGRTERWRTLASGRRCRVAEAKQEEKRRRGL